MLTPLQPAFRCNGAWKFTRVSFVGCSLSMKRHFSSSPVTGVLEARQRASASSTRSAYFALLSQQRRSSSEPTVRSPSGPSSSSPSVKGSVFAGGDTTAFPNSAEAVEELFFNSVQARTVSNAQLRKYVDNTKEKDYLLALAAVRGSKAAGLKVNPLTYERVLNLLLEAGQLKAAMELYQHMTSHHMSPTPHTYALLMKMCLQRDMPEACQRLFHDLQRRGNRPTTENYALMIQSLAAEVPPKWEKAIELFDKMNKSKHTVVNGDTYNALMRVYLNMRPFDWRVVYNCYYEMRKRKPRIPLQWDSYLLLSEALRKGRAGRMRRFIAYVDAWMAATPLFSRDFWVGCAVYTALFMLVKFVGSYMALKLTESVSPSGSASESKLG